MFIENYGEKLLINRCTGYLSTLGMLFAIIPVGLDSEKSKTGMDDILLYLKQDDANKTKSFTKLELLYINIKCLVSSIYFFYI